MGFGPPMAKPRPTAKSAKKGSTAGPRTGRPHAPARPRRSWVASLDPLALAIVFLSLALRLWGVGDHLPDPTLGINVLDDTAVEETDRTTSGRAWAMWEGGTKPLDLNPHTAGWPALSFYAALGLQYGYKLVFLAGHPDAGAAAYSEHVHVASNRMFLFARITSALVGVASVYLTFLAGAALWGRAAGLLAAVLLAMNPLHILTSQHIADPNLLALFFVLVATLAMIRVSRGGSTADSIVAGAMIGLAGACKYAPLVLVIPLVVAHFAPDDGRKRRPSKALSDLARNRALYLALVAVLVALFAGSPYTFLDWKTTLKDIGVQRRALFSDWVGQTTFPISLPTYLAVSLPHAMGWPAYLLSLAGMAFLWRRDRAGQAAALVPGVVILANGALRTAQERYILVAVPLLFVGAAAAMEWGYARWRARSPGLATAGAAALVAICVAWPAPEFLAVRRAQALPDTRHLARRWIIQHLGPERPTAVELYGPVFQPGERAFVIWPFFATQVPEVRPAYHAEFLDGFDFYVLSREVSRRFDADSTNYPVESAYYRWIRAHAPIVWETDPDTTSGPQIEVRRIPSEVSTRAERDSVFALAMPAPSGVSRVALWCFDTSQVFARTGNFGRSEEWARRGLRVGSNSLNARLCGALAYADLKLGRIEEAEQVAAVGVQQYPREAMLRLYYGMALAERGNDADAVPQLREAYQLSNDPRVLLNLGAALSNLGRYEEALQALSHIPEDNPQRATALRDMGVILLNHLGRTDEGLAALRESARLERDPGEVRLLNQEIERLEKQRGK
jgi:tetratricopeptide (TPR) repeat protein